VRTIRRAYLLVQSDTGRADESDCPDSVLQRGHRAAPPGSLFDGRVRRGALEDKPWQGGAALCPTRSLLDRFGASTPPVSQERWALKLLARQTSSDEQVVDTSPETVQPALRAFVACDQARF
jgi:hypothetical protein